MEIKISICIITFKRPAGLAKTLKSLEQMIKPKDSVIKYVIVDNDPAGSAEKIAQLSRLNQLNYYIEQKKGIPAARNRALKESIDSSDYISFIDDDEWVDLFWLEELVNSIAQTQGDVITGPVVPVYNDIIPKWLIDGGFYRRERFMNNCKISYARTSNVLIKSEVLNSSKIFFDESLVDTGGSDTLLFSQLVQNGCSIFWCDKATVSEEVAKKRSNYQWLIKRSFRYGNTLSITDIKMNKSNFQIFIRILKALFRISLGIISVPFSLLSRIRLLRCALNISKGLGMISGLVGIYYREYKTSDIS